LGTNRVNFSGGYKPYQALFGEMICTFLLMYVVLETACNPASKANAVMAPVAIGLAVFLAHSLLIPIDGCSINPTRTFGPAVVQSIRDSDTAHGVWEHMWVFWIGPLLGSAIACLTYKMNAMGDKGGDDAGQTTEMA